MLRGSGVMTCLKYDLKRLTCSLRFYLAIALVLLVMWDYLMPVKRWAASVAHGVAPWLFPHLTSGLFTQMTIMCGLIFILCDAPFLDDAQPFIIIRSGRGAWCAGQLLYILAASLLYTCAIAVGSALLLIPNLEFNLSWGKAISTLATGQIELDSFLSFNPNIFVSFTPLAATALSVFFCWLGCSCLGVILFFFNLGGNRMVGNVVAGALVLQDLFSMVILPIGSEYFSLVSLTRFGVLLSDLAFGNPGNMIYSAVVLTVIALLFALLSLWRTRKMSVSTTPAI